MRRARLRVTLALLAIVATAACAHPQFENQKAHAAYTADQVVLRVNELQNAAIAANRGGALAEADTRTIVTFCVDADKTLAATPSGWQRTVQTAWTAAKQSLPAVANPALSAAMGAVDVALASLGGTQ